MGYHFGALCSMVKMAATGNGNLVSLIRRNAWKSLCNRIILINLYIYCFVKGLEEYHCNYCQADCTSLRVKCAECTDFDLCLQVRAAGLLSIPCRFFCFYLD